MDEHDVRRGVFLAIPLSLTSLALAACMPLFPEKSVPTGGAAQPTASTVVQPHDGGDTHSVTSTVPDGSSSPMPTGGQPSEQGVPIASSTESPKAPSSTGGAKTGPGVPGATTGTVPGATGLGMSSSPNTTASSARSGGANRPGLVTIEGNNEVGHTFTAVLNDPDGVPDSGVSYRWTDFYGAQVGTSQSLELTRELIGKQVHVRVEYTDRAGNHENLLSRFSGSILNDRVGGTGAGIAKPDPGAPKVSLSGAATVKRGEAAKYTVSIPAPIGEDVSVDIRIANTRSHPDDTEVQWRSQRATIKAGETSATFLVETRAGDAGEYRVEIGNAVVGTLYAIPEASQPAAAVPQSMMMLSYTHPYSGPNTTEFSDYWKAIHAVGSSRIPYVLIMPDARPSAAADPGYVELLRRNRECGFKSLAYIRTNQQTRNIAEVRAEADRVVELYGAENIQGFYFDEISSRSSGAAAYLAELYNHVKTKSPDKLVVANPGTHISDTIAPYADIFMTNESSADDYLNHWTEPKSAFEKDPANAHRIMHTVHGTAPADYQKVLDLSRQRNAGWVYITSDSRMPDGRPYNDLPQGFGKLVDDVNSHGRPADPQRTQTLPVLRGADLGTSSVNTRMEPSR